MLKERMQAKGCRWGHDDRRRGWSDRIERVDISSSVVVEEVVDKNAAAKQGNHTDHSCNVYEGFSQTL